MLGLALASRPMGLGSGVFTLLVFFGLSLAFCFVGRHSTSPGCVTYLAIEDRTTAHHSPTVSRSKFYGLAIVLPGLVATFLFLAPKEGDLRTSASQVRLVSAPVVARSRVTATAAPCRSTTTPFTRDLLYMF